ncbi:hypothetical protein ACTI_64690 [Actinoplanes sp. OR16]|nr:hypothetical protein ACTI_64690 [Actinoplanes sp. OR16]
MMWTAGAAALALVAIFLVFVLPLLIVPPLAGEPLSDSRLKVQNEVRTTMVQMIGGIVLLCGVFLTYRQYRLNTQSQVTERFTEAVEHLGSKSLAVRVGGIYALARLDRDYPAENESLMDVLAASVRQPFADDEPSTRHLRADLQAAATILGHRRVDRRTRVNLRRAPLAHVHLRDAHYERMALTKADFRRGQLRGINLEGALLRGAVFDESIMEGAFLTGAFLVGASLREVRLDGATLDRAWLLGARLDDVQWGSARCDAAYCDPAPILSWMRDHLGAAQPWKWSAVMRLLDTPGSRRLAGLTARLPADDLPEGLRQIRRHLGGALSLHSGSEVTEVQIEGALSVRGKPA